MNAQERFDELPYAVREVVIAANAAIEAIHQDEPDIAKLYLSAGLERFYTWLSSADGGLAQED